MADTNRSKLVRIGLRNIGCIGNDALEVQLDNIVCLVGKNNSGKSTILRGYELAKGTVSFDRSRDRYQHSTDGQPSEILLEVHIPDGIGNVDTKWKTEKDGLLIVKSRWQWAAPDFQKVRTTWDPSGGSDGRGEWAEDGKAGGADPVFSSRLPRPLRIGSLDDAAKTEEMLLTLALSPLLSNLENERANPDSPLAIAIGNVTTQINALSEIHKEHFNKVAGGVTTGFQGVFPALNVRLAVASAPLIPKVADLVKSGSELRIKDGKADTTLGQQGTGARRALFWAMLQVHNELTREKELRDEYRKKLNKALGDEEKKKGAKKVSPEQILEHERKIAEMTAQLAAHDEGSPIPESPDDPAFPGYLLLIDEPENALHPIAARAAQRHLYRLAESPDWQVMMTTHSPYFINPFEDHTTIVRLEREAGDDDSPIEPKTYRSDLITFEGDDKDRLKALQNIDPNLAEIFFGSYPVLVEGDTEHAAFIAAIIERQHELMEKVAIVRTRGKAILVPFIKVMNHFRINFGIIHDCDPPYKTNRDNNGMWTENGKIRDAILLARANGITVRHRVSIPDFERTIGGEEESKDKPLIAYRRITQDAALGEQIQELLNGLVGSEQHEPFPAGDFQDGVDYLELLRAKVMKWASDNGLAEEPRFQGRVAGSPGS